MIILEAAVPLQPPFAGEALDVSSHLFHLQLRLTELIFQLFDPAVPLFHLVDEGLLGPADLVLVPELHLIVFPGKAGTTIRL